MPHFSTKSIFDFNTQRMHIAIVVDKNKNNIGVVTIEDLLEEIFGEIEDEFDKSKQNLINLSSLN